MSLDKEGFDKKVQGSIVQIQVENRHPLIKLCNDLDWEALMRYASGQVRPLNDKKLENEQNNLENEANGVKINPASA